MQINTPVPFSDFLVRYLSLVQRSGRRDPHGVSGTGEHTIFVPPYAEGNSVDHTRHNVTEDARW